MGYQIKEVSELLDISIYTLRYYEKIGLLDNVQRDAQGRRDFSESDILTLNTVECLKNTGMSLKEIKHYVDLIPQGIASAEERLAIFKRQQAKVEEKIADLKAQLKTINDKVTYYDKAVKEGTLNVCHDERDALVQKLIHH